MLINKFTCFAANDPMAPFEDLNIDVDFEGYKPHQSPAPPFPELQYLNLSHNKVGLRFT
jgi:hypothetical protein